MRISDCSSDVCSSDLIGLGEIARRPEALMQGAKEVEIQVDLVVARAIERPHGRAGEAAGGLDAAGEEHQAGFLIGAAEAILEYPVPHRLGVGENQGDEVAPGVVERTSTRLNYRH